MGIEETLCRDLAKLVMIAAGGQENMECRNQKLCKGLEAGIERENHVVGERRRERSERSRGEDDREEAEVVDEQEMRGGGLTGNSGGTDEEAVQNMESELEVEVEGDEEGEGNLKELGDTGLLMQEAYLVEIMLIDDHNGFNELSRLTML